MEDLTASISSDYSDCRQVRRIRNYAWYFSVAWTLLLAFAIISTNEHKADSVATHVLIWVLGLCMTGLGAKQLIHFAWVQKLAEADLNEQANQLKKEIADRQAIQESLLESEKRLQEQNYELLTTEEMLRVQLGEYEISQMKLKESITNLQAIFNVSPLPIIITTHDEGVVREINRIFSTTFGYQRDKAIGKTSLELGIWSDVSERHHFIRTFNEKRGLSGFAAEIRNGRGEVRSIMMYSTTIEYNNEPCLLTVIMDVTDQKRIENELCQSQKMDVVGQLAGGVSHDFNDMLTAIIGSAEMMERYVAGNPAQAKLLNSIQEAAGRAADLTSQLLAFSRKSNKLTVQIMINKTIQSVISLLERTIDKNIRLETRLTASNDLITGDPTQIQNALLNLGINARDAMPGGGVITYSTATMFLDSSFCESLSSSLQPGHYVEISVSDTGPGIKKEIIEHIFEPFFSANGLGKGSGLGLTAVYGTVREHQGCINVYSESGIGTVFKLYIPLASHDSTVIHENEPTRGSGAILLVDDESLIREIGRILLEEHGYQVFLAEDGVQALELYERERDHIKLVILDVVMPVMGGKESLQSLKESYPDVKVLISSGFHQDESDDSFIKLGAKGFIQKPYRTQELYKAVEDALAS